jgi:hypothetical protein
MHADDIINLLKTAGDLSDREIADALFGPRKPQQTVNQVCRKLAQRGLIVRQKGANGIVANFIADGSCAGSSLPSKGRKEAVAAPTIPLELSKKAQELGKQWAEWSGRPRLNTEIKRHWDALIEAWISDREMPLAVRKMGGVRGGVVTHQDSGREVVLTDNSPAQWAFYCALRGDQYSLDDLRSQIKSHSIPFTFATKRAETSEVKYRGTLSSCAINLNADGWKLCHIDPVGLRARTLIKDLPVAKLQDHSRLLLRPSNHFLVPKRWAGLGEIPEVIEEIRAFESCH